MDSSKSKIIQVKTDPVTGDGIILLDNFKDFVDISQVHSYILEPILNKDGGNKGLILKFFDLHGNQIKTKE